MSPDKDLDENRDPISGQPGAHPVETGIGAAGVGAVATAVGGVVGGPVGAVVGAVVGSVAGGLAGKGVGEKIDPTVEEDYWRTNYTSRPYIQQGESYDDYAPAYRTGYMGYGSYAGRSYHEVEPDLRRDYETNYGQSSNMTWERAKHATKDAWDRVERAIPGDADHDGK